MASQNPKPKKHAPPKPRLGRGLSSLITGPIQDSPDDDTAYRHVTGLPPIATAHQAARKATASGQPQEIRLDDIASNPYQPRREFNAEALSDLTASIASQGIIQPLIVAAIEAPGGQVPGGVEQSEKKPFVLVAGERRLRAARQAGLATVPCLVRRATPQQMLEWALIENIQRSDLNPIERAEAYRKYIDRFGLTQAQAGERLGQPRATVANYLRLLELQDEVKALISQGALSFGHAKLLAGVSDPARQRHLARRIARTGMSVRQLETLLESGRGAAKDSAARATVAKPPYLADLEQRLTQAIGTRVVIQPGRAKNSGRVVIDYYSLEDFDRISAALGLRAE